MVQAVRKKCLKDSELICSFPPVVADNSQILVLGSMPGEKSLEMRQYYAHPANFFWKFMLQAAGITDNPDYANRLAILSGAGIALWDVLRSCRRHGSLDSAIEKASEQPNAIPELLQQYPQITKICFNGQKAFASFKKHFIKNGSIQMPCCQMVILPSTSPANASIPSEIRFRRWQNEVWQPHRFTSKLLA